MDNQMTNEQIRKIALANGFKLKKQPNGEMDLNPYVYDAMRAVYEQGKADAMGWVSVDERLPENSGYCLVAYSHEIGVGKVHQNWFSYDWNEFGEHHRSVTHWQPLPQSPREANNE